MSRYRIRDLYRTETPIVLGDGDSLRIDPLGLLQMRVPGPAILLTGGTATIRHAGEITLSSGTPVIAGTLTTPFDIRIVTSASLPPFNVPDIVLASDEDVGGTLHIRNSAGDAINGALHGGIDVSGLHADLVVVVNSGRISGSISDVAYRGSLGVDVVLNSGVIDDDILLGDGNDILRNSGSIGARIDAGAGDDRLHVGDGFALIRGGTGRDVVWGGTGSNGYFFNTLADSGPDRARADVIHGYDRTEGDFIVLREIDADLTTTGDQGFRFVGTDTFSGAAGELRCHLLKSGGAVLFGDVDGDAQSDFALVIHGTIYAPADIDLTL